MSEQELFHAGVGRSELERRTVSSPCSCGGRIVVYDGDDDFLIARAVRVHNESTAHARWAIAAGLR